MAANDIKQHTGEQIILSSGRLVFNSRANDIYLNAKRYINFSAGDKVTIDVGNIDSDDEMNMFLVNAPRMQFGLDKNGAAEPIVKGEQLDEILSQLMETLAMYSDMVAATVAVPATVATSATFLKGRLQGIKANLENFKSTKSFTI
jgi:hypothetical protein